MVPHRERPLLASRFPVHVTLRLADGLPTLRDGRVYAQIRACFAAANRVSEESGRARVVHYAVLRNHVHLLVEAKDRDALSRGLQGLGIRLARAVNRFAERTGAVFGDRYHAHILRTPREVRNALAYVLNNARHDGIGRLRRDWIDPYSSAAAFDGWLRPVPRVGFAIPVARAHTWLLTKGWRRHGLLDPAIAPAAP